MVELERAKRAAISVISNALESKATSSEDIGRQFLTYGHRIRWEAPMTMFFCVFLVELVGSEGRERGSERERRVLRV